jgi:hypothetical protein
MSENQNTDGTPAARFDYIMSELEKRFPDPHPFDSSHAPEQHYLAEIDRVIEDSRELTAAKMQVLNLFSHVPNVFTKEK